MKKMVGHDDGTPDEIAARVAESVRRALKLVGPGEGGVERAKIEVEEPVS